jgi:polysaccharide export outer membrane protein
VNHRTGIARPSAHAGRLRSLASHSARLAAATARSLALIAALASAACTTPPPAGPPTPPPIEGYVVGAPDELQVQILPAPEILRNVKVRPDGKISIDLVGDVQAAGRTPFEIAQTIQSEISRYKRDASVNVAVVTSSSRFVTIYGEVGAPSTFPLEAQTRVSEAIGRVGGPRPFAKLNGVRIIRPRVGGAQILEVNLGDIQQGDLSTNFVIQEGDLIVVPPTMLARIGYAVQMVLFPFQPLISGASSFGGAYAGVSRAAN